MINFYSEVNYRGGPFDGTEKGPLDGTERGPLDGTAVCFSANFFRKRGASMVQRDFQKKFYASFFTLVII